MKQQTTCGMTNGPALSLRNRLVLGTALATSAFLGGYRGYVRRAYAACAAQGGIYTCTGGTATTQALNGAPLIVTTAPGFSINTAGDAFSLTGTGGLTFTDANASLITGSTNGIDATNYVGGVLTITTTGTVTANTGLAISANNDGTDLTIDAVDATGAVDGIVARNYGSGALSITSTGTVTGTGNIAVYARNFTGTDLTIDAVDTTGGSAGIVGINYGSGALSITSTGTATGTGTFGVDAINSAGSTDLTINAVDTTGGAAGILAINYGSGALTIIATGTATGGTYEGITTRNFGTDLTIQADDASGGTSGVSAQQLGTGLLSITVTGTVIGGAAGIYAGNGSATTTSTTSVSVRSGATVTGGTAGVDLVSSTGRTANVDNAGSISGATGILADTVGAVTITNAGSITGTGGTAIDLISASSATLNQQSGTVSGDVLLSANSDVADIVGGNIIGAISGGGGNDTITISGGAVSSIVAGAGNDTVRILGGVMGTAAAPGGVELGAGADTFEMSGGTVFGGVSGEGGADAPAADSFVISGGTINGSVFGLGGGNTFQVSGSTINGSIFAGSQNDTVTISGTANIPGDAAIGPDAVGLEDGNDTFSMSGGTLGGAVSGGNGNDVLAISGGTVNSFVAGNDGTDQITISGGTITGDVDAETVILTGGTIGGDITGITGNTLIINDGGSAAPLVLRDGVVFSGTNAIATITNTDLSVGGTKTQFFQGFDSVTVDPSTIKFGTGTNSIGLLNLEDGSILFVDGNAILTGTANVVGSTINMVDGAANDTFTLGGLVLNNGTIGLDVNQQTIAADQLAASALTGIGVNVINVNLLGAPVFTGQTDIPIITTAGPVTGTFIATGLPGTQGSLFTYEILQGATGLFIRATPANIGLALAPQSAADVSTIDTALDALYGINDDAIEFDLGLGNGPAMAKLSDTFGVFASGQFAHTEHDGFDISTGNISGTGPGFDANDFSAAISLDFNAAKHFGFEDQYGLNLGLFGGYASTDVALEDFAGFIDTGDADNKSAMFGGYGLFRKEFNYMLISATAFLGETDIFNGVLDTSGSYGTEGYAVTGSVGHIFVLSERTRFDLRGGLLGVTFKGDDYTDSNGNQFGGSEISFGAVKFEPGIYGDFQLENGMTFSPYARADLQQRFGYKNTATIGTAEVDFNDSDFSAALSTGFNLKMSQTTTVSGEVRGKLSSDSATIGGKLGIKVAF